MKATGQDSSGLLLVDKPTGITSHTVVAQVRKSLLKAFPHWDPRSRPGFKKIKGGPRPPRFKCGHAGTLDPLATGLLLVLVGKGSRLSPFLMGMDKSYLATVRFGQATDSHDSEGVVTATAEVPTDPQEILKQMHLFQGDILQVPPLISALKFQGQPLYKLVRQGRPLPELKARPVTISRLEVVAVRWDVGELDLLVECSSGTYIRSLARDLAQAGGTEGHLTGLRRLTVGPFSVDKAVGNIQDLSGEEMASACVPLVESLPGSPRIDLDLDQAAALRKGVQPDPTWFPQGEKSSFQNQKNPPIFRLVGPQGDLVAVAKLDPETLLARIAVVIPQETEAPGSCD